MASPSYYYSSTAGTYTLTGDITTSSLIVNLDGVTGLPGNVPFKVVIDPGQVSEEIVKVNAMAGSSLTVVRAWDGTTASSHSAGAVVRHMLTASDLTLSRAHEAASSSVHGTTSAVVGTTDAQALTNKDLTDATNTFPASLATDAELAAHTTSTAAHGATGAVVGTTNTQTLTNKNLTSTTNVFPATLATDSDVAAASASATSALNAHAADTSTHGVTSGAIVGTSQAQTLTNKNLASSSNVFPTKLSDTGIDTTAMSSQSAGWDVTTNSARVLNGVCQVYITATRTGASIPAGNVSNSPICILATPYRPSLGASGSSITVGYGQGYVASDGTVVLAALGSSLPTGGVINLGFTYLI